MADTLAWVRHLLGDNRTAAPMLEQAAASSGSVTIILHSAIVHTALNDVVRATRELDTYRASRSADGPAPRVQGPSRATGGADAQTMTDRLKHSIAGTALVLAGVLLVYWPVFTKLVHDWAYDDNYSHGFLIVPLALYFVWERRARLEAIPIKPAWTGLLVFVGGILVLLAGLLGSELFLSRISIIGTVAGMIVFLFGWRHLRALTFPLAFLLLMIPIPAIIFNQIAFPLQLFASKVGEAAISAANIPVLREGNVLILANTTLEVAEACSGIRSLVSLITLGIVYGYFTDSRAWVRLTLVASTIPVAILSNGARVAGTGIAAHWLGAAAAEGFLHQFSGWVVFVIAFLMILSIQRFLVYLAPATTVQAGGLAGIADDNFRRELMMRTRVFVLFACLVVTAGVVTRANRAEEARPRMPFAGFPARSAAGKTSAIRRSPRAS